MADEIEKAIIAATDAYTPYHTRTMAINQLIEFAETPEGWKTFAQKLFETSRFEVVLYCISTLSDFASKRYSDLSQDEKSQLKEALFSFIYQKSSVLSQDAVMKKMALTIVHIFKIEFPNEWSSFFDDISTMFLTTSDNVVLSKDIIDQVNPQSLPSPEFVLMYLNILLIIDQEVASSEISRSPIEELRATATRIKDTMREIAIPKLVDLWYTILVLYHEQHIEVSKACLQVIKLYVSWIDIRLVVNNLFLPLLVKLISKKEYASLVIECLYEILLKGMPDPRSKLELFESLHVPEILQSLSFGSDESLEVSASRVVGVLGTELLQCINKLSNQIEQDVILQNVVKNLLNSSLQLLFTYFSSENDEASQNLIQFSIMYLNYLRKLKESQSNQLSESSLEHLNILLQILLRKCKYHDHSTNNFNFQTDNIDDDFMEYRKDLNKLFLSITTLNPDLVAGFIASLIQNIRDIQDPFELEVVMHFFYLMGECVQDKLSGNALYFAEMISTLATSQIVSYDQPHFVHTAFFEVIGRYTNQLLSKPDLLPIILQVWVDQPGILNPNPKAREQHCYLFTRFVKSLKDQLQPYLETIVNHLKGLVLFTPESFELMEKDQQIELFESIAVLIGSNKTATDIHQQYFNLLLTPLIDQIKEIMSKEMYINNNDVILWLKGLIIAIGTFAKGFPLQVQGGERVVLSPNAVSFFTDTLGIVSKVLSILYESYDIKESCSFFVSKILVTIPYENYSPYIEDIIENLLTPLSVQNMICGVKLFVHFITISSSKGYYIIDKLFMPIVLRFIEVINKTEPLVTPKSEEERELIEVKNLYFTFLHHILMSSETNVLISPTNIEHVTDVLYTLLHGCKTYDDINIQKTAFGIFKCLTEQWAKKENENQGFINFIYQDLFPQLFEVPLNKNFSLDDGRTNEVLTEISNLEQTIYECRGEEFQMFLTNYLSETLKANQEQINMYVNSLMLKDPKQFRKTKRESFKDLLNKGMSYHKRIRQHNLVKF